MVEWLVLELFLCPRDDKGFLLLTMLMLGVVAKTTNEMKGGKGLMMTCAAAASVMNYFRGLPGNAEYLGAYMYMCRIQLRGPVGCIGCFVPLMYRHVSSLVQSSSCRRRPFFLSFSPLPLLLFFRSLSWCLNAPSGWPLCLHKWCTAFGPSVYSKDRPCHCRHRT